MAAAAANMHVRTEVRRPQVAPGLQHPRQPAALPQPAPLCLACCPRHSAAAHPFDEERPGAADGRSGEACGARGAPPLGQPGAAGCCGARRRPAGRRAGGRRGRGCRHRCCSFLRCSTPRAAGAAAAGRAAPGPGGRGAGGWVGRLQRETSGLCGIRVGNSPNTSLARPRGARLQELNDSVQLCQSIVNMTGRPPPPTSPFRACCAARETPPGCPRVSGVPSAGWCLGESTRFPPPESCAAHRASLPISQLLQKN